MEDPIDVGNDGENEEYEVQSVEVLSSRLFKKLTRLPFVKGLAEHIKDLKECPPGREVYAKEMPYPQKILEQRFSRLELEGHRVEVMEYETKENVKILVDALSDFYPNFRINYRTKSQLGKMPIIHSLFTSPEN